MPRETVYGVGDDWDIQVGWSEETVQLGVTSHSGKSIAELLDDTTKYDGLWSTLSVDQINQLIRLLRKARDRAFDM